MQYPKVFDDNKPWLVSGVQSGKKIDEESGSVPDVGPTNLIINYLPSDMAEQELYEIFAKIGEVAKYKIVRNKRTGLSLGYGFVEFKNANAARIAQITCNRHVIRGKSLKVAFARPRSDAIINANLYVTHLPYEMDESKLATLFGCYGTIIDVKVLRCKFTGLSRGVGFVRFDQRLAAEVARKALDKYVLQGTTRPLSVQFANGSVKAPLQEPFSFSPKDYTTRRQMDPETLLPLLRSPEPYIPIPRPIKREMEPEIEQTVQGIQEPYHIPRPIKREMDPEVEQTVQGIQEPYPIPQPIKREMEPEIEHTPMRIQELGHFPLAIKRQMEPEIGQTANRIQETCHLPLAIKRQMEPEIGQNAKRSPVPYPFPPLIKRPMESRDPEIQQPEIGQTAKRSSVPYAFPPLINRHMETRDPEIQMRLEMQHRHMCQEMKHRQMELAMKQRQMNPDIQHRQMNLDIQHRQLNPDIQHHQMGLEIQQSQMNQEIKQDAKRTESFYPYPWLLRRPMESEIEQIAKRACEYDNPHGE